MKLINRQYGENATFIVTTVAVVGFKVLHGYHFVCRPVWSFTQNSVKTAKEG